MRTAILSFFLSFLLLGGQLLSPAFASAYTIPAFSACPNPSGSLIVNYSSGNHGIPGDYSSHSGSDAVYQTDSSRLVQCFCPDMGSSGIQTNWWKAAGLTQSDLDSLANLGWVFIPDGSAWGLDPAPYLAQNSSFTCGSVSSSQSSYSAPGAGSAPVCDSAVPAAPTLLSVDRTGTTARLTWTKVDQATTYLIFYGTQPGRQEYSVPDTGNVTTYTIGSLVPGQQYYFDVRSVNNCMPSAAAAVGGGAVLGASSFAPTGNILTLIAMAGLGVLFLALSLISRRFSKS